MLALRIPSHNETELIARRKKTSKTDVKIGRRKEIKRAAEGEESNKHNI